VLVTGANGGVGSVAIALLRKLGYTRGRLHRPPAEAEHLKALGAAEVIIDRAELSAPGKPLQKERWAGVVDSRGQPHAGQRLRRHQPATAAPWPPAGWPRAWTSLPRWRPSSCAASRWWASFVGRAGALPEIWSYGHRNPQGATHGPDGKLWMHEHGPQGGDEINLPQPGRNYGWPVITYGENYGGGKMGEGTARAGMEQPLHQWTPSIAPSGMAFLTSMRYGTAWQGSLLVGALAGRHVARLELAGGKVVRETRLLSDLRERIRDVRQGPDGLIYLLTDHPQGRLLRLTP
jgi:hypothetical protein